MPKSVNQLIDWIVLTFFKQLLPILSRRSLKSLQKDTRNALQVQKHVLNTILKSQKDTEYGKSYNFAMIESADEFCSKHPLTSYEHYRSIIDNIANSGNYTKLVAEPIILFQETAGTTGQTKLIPRTKRLFSTHQKAFQAVNAITESYPWQQNTPKTQLIGLPFTNAQPLQQTPSGIPKGTGTSGGIKQSKLTRNVIRLKFSSPTTLFLISDYTVAYYCHLLFGLLEPNLNYISANFASNVLQGLQILEQSWKQLVNDIELGEIDSSLDLDPSIRQELEQLLEPNPERASVLKQEFVKGFEGILPRIWPQLCYIQCITTGTMQIYQERLNLYAGGLPIYSHGYGASEAWIGVNLDPQRNPPAYVITPHAAFFEFIPVSEIDSNSPTTLTLTSLNVGESYEIVVTNVAGLYRYRLGDIIKCVGYYHQSPMVEFLYRQGSLLNFEYEKVSEHTILIALKEGINMMGETVKLVDYTTTMAFSFRPWRYVIYAEISPTPEKVTSLDVCRNQIDQSIGHANETYWKLRDANAIGMPEIKLLKTGSFEQLKRKILQNQSSEAQFKMPRLLKDSNLVNFLENQVIAS